MIHIIATLDHFQQVMRRDSDYSLGSTGRPKVIYVSKKHSHAFRPPPNDGNTYIIQDKRRPWIKHVSGTGFAYKIDKRDPKFRVSCYVNGKRIDSKHSAKAKPRQIEKSKHYANGSQDAPAIRLIGIKRVEQITGFGKSYIYENCGHSFPQRISFGTSLRSASRWVEAEVIAWAMKQASNRAEKKTTT
jgi:predicted DNA-binding transcriptional regulator AlpA